MRRRGRAGRGILGSLHLLTGWSLSGPMATWSFTVFPISHSGFLLPTSPSCQMSWLTLQEDILTDLRPRGVSTRLSLLSLNSSWWDWAIKARKETPAGPIMRPTLRHFKDIQDYEGVFVSGPYPHWLFLTAKGELRTHPMAN